MPAKKKPIEKKEKSVKDLKDSKESLVRQTTIKKPPPPKKEKDYGTMFTLLLHPQLEELDLKIESKLRILDTLPTKDWKLLSKSTQRYIDSLTIKTQELLQEFTKLKKEQKQNTSQAKLHKLNEELESELKAKKLLQEQILKTQELIKQASNDLFVQKEKLEEELNQEISKQEGIKTEITLKDLELTSLKENIMQVSSQIGLIKTINAQFNENIEKINKQIEDSNQRFYEAKAKCENSAEIKRKILDCQAEALMNEKKILKYYRKFKEIQAFMKNKENEMKNLLELEKKITEALETMPDFQQEHSAQALEKILKSLAAPAKKLERPVKKNKALEESVKIKNIEVMNLIKLKEIEKTSKEKALPDRKAQIAEVKELIKNNTEIFEEKAEYFKKQIAFLQGQTSALTKKQEDLKADLGKKKDRIEKLTKKYEETSEKLAQLQKNSENASNLADLRKKIEDTTKVLNKSEEHSIENSVNDKEKQLAHILLQLDVLKQEVAFRDSEIVLKVREKQKADEKLDALKVQMQKLSSKMKTAEAEILAKINEEIEGKDKQIEVLKEMLRGSHAEMKVKDVVLLNYRWKLDESSKVSKRS